MTPVLVTMVGAVAAAIWAVAVWRVIQVVQAVPRGQRTSLFFPGWPWDIDKAVARYGAQVEAPLRAFQRVFLLFMILVFGVMVVAIFAIAATTPR